MGEAKKEKDFIRGLGSVFEKTPSLIIWIFPTLFILLVLAIILWLTLSESEVVSQAQGKIIASRGLHKIQPKEQGKIDLVPVKEGEEVAENQVLAELEKKELLIEIEAIETEYKINDAEIYRYESINNYLKKGRPYSKSPVDLSQNILSQEKAYVLSQIELYKSEIATRATKIQKAEREKRNIDAEIMKLNKLIRFKDSQLLKVTPLVRDQLTTSEEYERFLEERITSGEDKKIKFNELAALESEIELNKRELELYQNRFYHENNEKLLAAYQKKETLADRLAESKERIKSRTLNSPIDGTVHNLELYTKGSVVRPADVMMEIIPKDSPLEVEAKVLNKDVGFIHVGQKVRFKVDSFPFTKYGAIDGQIKKIERASVKDDQLGDIYPVIVELDKRTILVDGKEVQLIPGMSGVVDIKTGERQMIEFVLSPIMKYLDEAARER